MAAVADFLRRFRAHGVPGAPTPAGVPVDRRQAIESELASVFAALDEAQSRAAAIARDGEYQAQRTRAAATARAQEVTASARRRAEQARDAAVAEVLSEAQTQAAAVVDEARRHAERIDAAAEGERERLAEHVVAVVLERSRGAGRR